MPEIVEIAIKVEFPDDINPNVMKSIIEDIQALKLRMPWIVLEIDEGYTPDQVIKIEEYLRETYGRKE